MISRINLDFKKITKFGIVGCIGTIINIASFALWERVFQINYNLSALMAFGIAVTNNYIWNHLWTFKTENQSVPLNIKYYVFYVGGNIVGLCVNLVILNLITIMIGKHYSILAQCCGVLFSMAFNFLFAKKMVFLNKNKQNV